MRFDLLILIATGLFILNIYHDGKYINLIKSWKKYYQMTFYAFLGFSLFIFVRKYPAEGKSLFTHANSFIKCMPIDKDSADMISPFFGASSYLYKNMEQNNSQGSQINSQHNRMMNSGRGQSVGGGGGVEAKGKATSTKVSVEANQDHNRTAQAINKYCST